MTKIKKPHKHAECIKAWADGCEIELMIGSSGKWNTSSDPSWESFINYRIKPTPVMAWYRVAEAKNGTWIANASVDLREIESSTNFIRWLTDRIEYEVTP